MPFKIKTKKKQEKEAKEKNQPHLTNKMNRDTAFCRFIENLGKLRKLIHVQNGTHKSEYL